MLQGLRLSLMHGMAASAAILLAYLACEGMHEITHLWLSHVLPHMHAVFLPFGVLVLLGWVYGWLAVPLAVPAALLSLQAIVGVGGMTADLVGATVVKVVSVPLAFTLFRLSGVHVRGEGRVANWRCVVKVGLLASILGNGTLALFRLWGGDGLAGTAEVMLMALAADVSGMIAVLLVAMLGFRLLRQV